MAEIGTRGLAATTVRGLCTATGLNPRYFYESFDSLDDLLIAAFDELIGRAAAAVQSALDAAPDTHTQRARAAMDAFLEATTADPRTARILFLEGLASERLLKRRFESARRLARITMPEESDAAVRDFIAGGLTYLILGWLDGGLDLTRAEVSARAVELALGTLRSVPS